MLHMLHPAAQRLTVPPYGSASLADEAAGSTKKDSSECTDSVVSHCSTGLGAPQSAEFVQEPEFLKHTLFVSQALESLTARMTALEKFVEGAIPAAAGELSDKGRAVVQELVDRFESTEAETATWLRKLDDTAASLNNALESAAKRWRDESNQLWEAIDSHTHDVNMSNVEEDGDELQTMPAAVFRGRPTENEEIETSPELLFEIGQVIAASSAITNSSGADSQRSSCAEEATSQKRLQWSKDGDTSDPYYLDSSQPNPTVRPSPHQTEPVVVATMATLHTSGNLLQGTGAVSFPVTPLAKTRATPMTYTRKSRTCSSVGSPSVPSFISGTPTQSFMPRGAKRTASIDSRHSLPVRLAETKWVASTGSLAKPIAMYSPPARVRMSEGTPWSLENGAPFLSSDSKSSLNLSGFISPRGSIASSSALPTSTVVHPVAHPVRQISCPEADASKNTGASTGKFVVLTSGGAPRSIPGGSYRATSRTDSPISRGMSAYRFTGGGSCTLPRARQSASLDHRGGLGAGATAQSPASFAHAKLDPNVSVSAVPHYKIDLSIPKNTMPPQSPVQTPQSPVQMVRTAGIQANIVRQTSGPVTSSAAGAVSTSILGAQSAGSRVTRRDARSQDSTYSKDGSPAKAISSKGSLRNLMSPRSTVKSPRSPSNTSRVATTPVVIAVAGDVKSPRNRRPPQSSHFVESVVGPGTPCDMHQGMSPAVGYRAALSPVQGTRSTLQLQEGPRRYPLL